MKINNVSVHEPKYGGIAITDEPIWSSDTNRNNNGEMVGDIKAWKKTIEVTFPPLSLSDSETIRNAIKNAGAFFSIEYPDFSTQTMVTTTVYSSNIKRTLMSLQYARHADITVTFIEK